MYCWKTNIYHHEIYPLYGMLCFTVFFGSHSAAESFYKQALEIYEQYGEDSDQVIKVGKCTLQSFTQFCVQVMEGLTVLYNKMKK